MIDAASHSCVCLCVNTLMTKPKKAGADPSRLGGALGLAYRHVGVWVQLRDSEGCVKARSSSPTNTGG